MPISSDLEIKNEIHFALKNANIQNTDCVLFHADISKNLIKFKRRDKNFKLKTLLDIMFEYFNKGTLIFPTFNFDFCNNLNYDYFNTPSRMGILSEEARKQNLESRTLHPVYSFVAFGENQEKFIECDNFEAFSKKSPFEILLKLNGKIISWNLPDQKSMTFYHFIERENKVSYRFDKIFVGNYIDKNKKISKKKYSIFVRKIDQGVTTNVSGMEKILWKNNLFSGDKYNKGTGLRSIETKVLFDKVSEVIDKDMALGNLYNIK